MTIMSSISSLLGTAENEPATSMVGYTSKPVRTEMKAKDFTIGLPSSFERW
jgi:hypothetical protein